MPADVSVIIPIYNGDKWVDRCFNSIMEQTAKIHGLILEVSVYNDASTDTTCDLLDNWKNMFIKNGTNPTLILGENNEHKPKGVGYAKNQAIKQSTGKYLCFHDIDDIMMPDRIWKQYNVALEAPNSIIGCKFVREPPNSTPRFTNWANELPISKLETQIYTSHGPTIIMPTWFCKKEVFERVGSFSEGGKGIPEDLIFFYQHLKLGGQIKRVDDVLLIYKYHKEATTLTVLSDTIWTLRIRELEENFLSKCKNGFTIWNAGKEGRKFARTLNSNYQDKITSLCDVDIKKIGKTYEMYCPHQRKVLRSISIVHYSKALPPYVICVKMDMTDGELENNIKNLNIKEGIDYIMFN